MAGIYIHIPFCTKACHYCNFHFSTTLRLKNDFIRALLKEIRLRADYLSGQTVDTLYFGGGTPSLLEGDELEAILLAVRESFTLAPGLELTLEANPDDFSAPKLAVWQKAGINRLSIGVQSFDPRDLKWMNRVHTAQQATEGIRLARQAGIDNFSIDLIYGTPTLSDAGWLENLDHAIALQIPHLSCYALTVEPGTALDKMISLHKKEPTDPEKQARQFLLLLDRLEAAGYEHYEISNFALPGRRSRHNSSYWTGAHYLGLGPSAHSFNGDSRQWNLAHNPKYIESLDKGVVPFEIETLKPVQQLNEYIMTSLRTCEGLDLDFLEARFGKGAANKLKVESRKYLANGQLVQAASYLQLSREGKLFADGIAASLFGE